MNKKIKSTMEKKILIAFFILFSCGIAFHFILLEINIKRLSPLTNTLKKHPVLMIFGNLDYYFWDPEKDELLKSYISNKFPSEYAINISKKIYYITTYVGPFGGPTHDLRMFSLKNCSSKIFGRDVYGASMGKVGKYVVLFSNFIFKINDASGKIGSEITVVSSENDKICKKMMIEGIQAPPIKNVGNKLMFQTNIGSDNGITKINYKILNEKLEFEQNFFSNEVNLDQYSQFVYIPQKDEILFLGKCFLRLFDFKTKKLLRKTLVFQGTTDETQFIAPYGGVEFYGKVFAFYSKNMLSNNLIIYDIDNGVIKKNSIDSINNGNPRSLLKYGDAIYETSEYYDDKTRIDHCFLSKYIMKNNHIARAWIKESPKYDGELLKIERIE